MKLINPVPGHRVNSRWGKRKPIIIAGGKTLDFHYGDDRAARIGTPIVSVLPGRVVRVGSDSNSSYEQLGLPRWPGLTKGWLYGGGYWVFIKTGNLTVRYMHLRRHTHLKVGDWVDMGQHIGDVGATGAVTGPHLHMETLIGNRWVDPQSINANDYLNPGGSKKVSHKNIQNREEGRKIKPGQTLFLVDSRGKKQDLSQGKGLHQFTIHLGVTGLTPGETFGILPVWFKAGKTGARHAQSSPHYRQTVVADKDGNVRENVTFVRSVADRDWQVHVHIISSRNNTRTGTVEYIDADVLKFS